MNPTYDHPSLTTYVTEPQRDRAESWLQEAYADRRITEAEFDHRIGQVISAVTRKDLNDAFFGLVQVPPSSRALGLHPAYQPLVRPETRQQAGRGVAGFAHFSVFLFWILGPALVFALSSPGTYARREAAKAFNFQLVSAAGFIGLGILGAITQLDVFGGVAMLGMLAWFVLTIVGGAKALQGDDWTNPVKRVVKLEVLKETEEGFSRPRR